MSGFQGASSVFVCSDGRNLLFIYNSDVKFLKNSDRKSVFFSWKVNCTRVAPFELTKRSLHLFDYDKHIPWLLQLSIGITVVWTSRIECWYSYEYALDVNVPGNFLRAFVYSDSKAECNPISDRSKLGFELQPHFNVKLKQIGFDLCQCRKYYFWYMITVYFTF